MRDHWAGGALAIFIGGDEQDTTSYVCWRVTWMLGRLEEPQIPCR